MKVRGQISAGILLYRQRERGIEVLLVLPGGPWWRTRDAGAWQMPKGAIDPGEDAAAAALREFEEELGSRPHGDMVALCRIRQKGGKWVDAFALEGDLDPAAIVSNRFDLEWPPRSGKVQSFPEVERAQWFGLAEAYDKILASQQPILDALRTKVQAGSQGPPPAPPPA